MIDLSSDTATKPSAAMRKAMAEAEVGDEQRQEDPTVNRLQEMVAQLTGKEAGLFVPSGTMCNAIAFAVHCRPGEAAILERHAHPSIAEGGGPAVIAGVLLRSVDGDKGVFTSKQARPMVSSGSHHASRTSLISAENTSNQGGGSVWPLDALADLRGLANEHGMKFHMDGARLMNAVVASDTPASVIASYADTTWVDLSKGLGAPVGAVLVGPKEFIEAGRLWKHRLGGAMRQAGVIAAAGIYAFEHNVERLAEDHANAKLLEAEIENARNIDMVRGPVQTNILLYSVARTGLNATEFASRLVADYGVRMSPYVDTATIRAVTHLDVSRDDCKKAGEAVQKLAASIA